MQRLWKEFSKGLWKELPPLRVLLGLCPTLAVTSTAENGLGMGLAVIFVLTLSNLIVSLLRRVIPPKVRIACFILIAATLVVTVELLMQAYVYPLYQKLGIFVPLIVVNCIILGRAEAFASKNSVGLSVADALGMGLGFTLSLTFLGGIRELLGNGTLFGMSATWDSFQPLSIMVQAPGAFLGLGLILAGMNALNSWYARRHEDPPPRALEAIASCSSLGTEHTSALLNGGNTENGTNGDGTGRASVNGH
ncbi:electron transport complex protein RnfE [Paucidesulfovibrio gracilis DSM 16080]|uniref:Ion-translocating oxidoreductase complex subunit E n=1 Tax=Paucidesulfovibrio gracilis DSM 16080 TaxID=1121449 RepID=A0A1T4X5M4_9BACT|nr:electron transport complex subunit E [Paucidesulfovibrio gracilis]SKA84846.1 electron transport complex protein RnfE [Paucidesulfovibrio gracilis DSM 16080]